MRRLIFPLFLTLSVLGCSSETPGDGGDNASGGSGGSSGTGQGGSNGGSAGSTATGGSGADPTGGSAGSGTTGGTTSGGSGGSGAVGGSGGGTGGAGWTKTGICDQRGEATVPGSDGYDGFEEFYIVSEECVEDGRVDEPTMDDLRCLIRFDVTRSGTGEPGCLDLDGYPCSWSQEVTYSNPMVVIDRDGACASSEIAWNTAWVEEMDGSTESYGYVPEYQGHDSVVMRYSDTTMEWVVIGRASWVEATEEFSFTSRFGECQY
jgi:hypothetical protein